MSADAPRAAASRVDGPRVIIRLLGGLGNQLFQWAAGRAVAQHAGATLLVDASALPTHISERLTDAGLPVTLAPTPRAVQRLLRMPGLWRLCRATGLQPRIGRSRLIFDRLRGFDPSLERRVPRNGTLVLVGYWQAPEWPHAVALELRAALPAPRESDIVAIHVRRGDYISNPRAAAYHGRLLCDYYTRALRALGAHADDRRLVVFTDDPAGVEAEGWLPKRAEFARKAHDLEHLALMAGASHIICANSSFSWWAAWLGDRPQRTIVCPAQWWSAAAGAIPHPAPAHWLRV